MTTMTAGANLARSEHLHGNIQRESNSINPRADLSSRPSTSPRAESDPLLSSSTEQNRRIPISEFSQRKGERVQNFYTSMNSQSRQGLNKMPECGSLVFPVPIRTENRSKSSHALDQSNKSSTQSSHNNHLDFGRPKSAENMSHSSRAKVTTEPKNVKSAKISLSEQTHELLKYWLPEGENIKNGGSETNNESLHFTGFRRSSLDLEGRL